MGKPSRDKGAREERAVVAAWQSEGFHAEVWRVIDECPAYEVSSAGRVRTAKTKRIRKPRIKANGYNEVNLYTPTGYRFRLIHRLVLTAFCGPKTNAVCRHLNGDRSDNRLINLAWGTRQQNEADKERHGTKLLGVNTNAAKLTPEAVAHIRSIYDARTHRKWGAGQLAEKYGVHPQTIKRAADRTWWKEVG